MTLNREEQRKLGLLLKHRGKHSWNRGMEWLLTQPKIMSNSLKHD